MSSGKLRSCSLQKHTYSFVILATLLLFSPLHSFAQFTKLYDFGTANNGNHPYSPVISDGTYLYGTTVSGGTKNVGIIYKIKPDGTGFIKLLDFDGTNGSIPLGALLLQGGFIYGTTAGGGGSGYGMIFKIKTDGTAFTDIFDFNYYVSGSQPNGGLITDGTFLYGTTLGGGTTGSGTAFKIQLDGTSFTKLHEFDYSTDGYNPYGPLLYDGTFLYGTTYQGGANSGGIIYKVKPDGSSYTRMRDLSSSDGTNSLAGLTYDGVSLYGTTFRGGANNMGTVFKINPDGTGFTNLADFNGTVRGSYPKSTLILDGTTLYGTTTDGGANDRGTIFRLKTDGTAFGVIASTNVGVNTGQPEGTLLQIGTTFYGVKSGDGAGVAPFPPGTLYKINDDGSGYTSLFTFEVEGLKPYGSLVSDGTYQYGLTSEGGLLNYGTIFKIKSDGTGFTRLFSFDWHTSGRRPTGSLLYDGTFLYGMTSDGGTNDGGTIFKIKPDGTGFTVLLNFDYTNIGGYTYGSLISDGTSLYGMTSNGGANSYGAIFKILKDGSGFVKLYDFDYNTTGAYPRSDLLYDGTYLYGTTIQGGINSYGTIFRIKTDGTAFSILYSMDDASGTGPFGSLISDGTFLYGMNNGGGDFNYGTIYKLKKDGTAFTKILDFNGDDDQGSSPSGALFSDGSFLYGMTSSTLFRIKPDGTGFLKFTDLNVGTGDNHGALTSDGTFLYGMTQAGGTSSNGIVFKTTKTPFVSITSFAPFLGVEGTLIKIKGTNFDPVAANNTVNFNGTPSTVVSSTGSEITAFVPVGATTGPIQITAGTTAKSSTDFVVTTEAFMVGSLVKNCDVAFVANGIGGYDDITQTFAPINPNDKVKVTWSSFDVSDQLRVYDGPSDAYPLLGTLSQNTLPPDYTSTAPGGELTFVWSWQDADSDWDARISCISTGGSTITITKHPSDVPVCSGGSGTFSAAATGTTNISYRWQFSPTLTGTFNDISNTGGYSDVATPILSVNTTGNFGAGFYRCKVNGDAASTVFTNAAQLTVSVAPATPTANDGSVCSGETATLTAAGGTNGQYKWYSVPVGGTAIVGQTNGSFITAALTTATSYYVSLVNASCESARKTVTVTINAPSPTPTAAGVTVCNGEAATLTAGGGVNGQYSWYTSASGGAAVAGQNNSVYTTPLLTSSTTYYVSLKTNGCESLRKSISVDVTACIPAITPASLTTQIGGKVTLNLIPLITTPNSSLDLTSLRVVTQPISGASASIDQAGVLTIDYNGRNFSGSDRLTIKACDIKARCSTQDVNIEIAGDITVFNGFSPGGLNPNFIIQYIDILPDTKSNKVFIFDRWENLVWQGTDYNNTSVVFNGTADNGNLLPSGVYFYKIEFAADNRKALTGFISLRRR